MSVRKLASGVLAALALLSGAVIADAKDPINVVDPFDLTQIFAGLNQSTIWILPI